MTVLDTRDPYIQYTGTGSRQYFEYGFAWNGETVVVEVDGVPVPFEYQANGVYLETPPALNAGIVIWRETDITQERNFTAFDAFVGRWTEDALDKLILLKQEAAIWRAQTNLRANHKLDRVTIENTQGTDPDIFLWNLDQSGVFAGEVTEAMPAVGQVVAKPWDFAYFQHGDAEPESPFVTYEYLMFATDQNYLVRYIGLDYENNEYTDFGSWYAGGTPSIVVDPSGDCVIQTSGTAGLYYQRVWRGNCFTAAYSEDVGGSLNNFSKSIGLLGNFDNKCLDCGCLSYGDGFAVINYEPDFEGTLDFSIQQTRTAPDDAWVQGSDFRTGDLRYKPGYGDVVLLFGTAAALVTYKTNGSTLVQQYVSGYKPNITGHNVGHDRDDGWWCFHSGTGLYLYDVDMDDYSITAIGFCDCADGLTVFAALPVPGTNGDMILTSQSSGATHRLRTYSRSGTVLTRLDDVAQINSNTNPNVRFEVSPFSNQIWLQGVGNQGSIQVTVDTDTGAIGQPYSIPYGTNSSGGIGEKSMGFLAGQLTAWGNGYTGIKAKLFQCWELDEAGTADRLPAFTDGKQGQRNLVNRGSMANTPSDVGNAALFDGASALEVESSTLEMGTNSTFSMCLDVTLASKATTQVFICRARDDWNVGTRPQDGDFYVGYSVSNDKFFWQIRSGSTAYTVYADMPTPVVTATKYHIYVAFEKLSGEIKIRVNGGTLYTLVATPNINRAADAAIQIGRRTSVSTGGYQAYMSNGSTMNQWFWFWDELTTAQQDYMYNSGNSRAFSEL